MGGANAPPYFPMLLTSVNRILRYFGDEQDTLTDNAANRRRILMILPAVSREIEAFIGRAIEKTTYTEYFDVTFGRTVYFPKAYPITSITTLREDADGIWSATSSTAFDSEDYFIGSNSRTIVTLSDRPYVAKKGIQAVYTGGFSTHGVNSTFAIGTVTGTLAAASYVKGATSGAVGIVNTAPASSSMVIENLYGVFEAGEQVDKTATEGADADGSNYVTISSITQQSLAEAYPDITGACEMEMRFRLTHRHDYENSGTVRDQTTRAFMPGSNMSLYQLRPETMAALAKYRRYDLGSSR